MFFSAALFITYYFIFYFTFYYNDYLIVSTDFIKSENKKE